MSGNIGFIGLGLMGEGFTRRLIEKGYRVAGFDIDAARTKAAAGWGVTVAQNAADVARQSDIILTCVINTAAVEAATLGADGIAQAPDLKGKIVVDHSTTELEATHRIAKALAARGAVANMLCYFVDAGGRLVDHAVNDRVMAIGLDVVSAVPNVVLAAGGPQKIAAIRAALKAVDANVLITDADTAAALVEG